MKKETIQSTWQLISLAVLRIAIGWHFLYEGLLKVSNPDWTAASFLNNSVGPLASFFNSLAASSSVLATVDFLNQWGLVAIGLSLMLGLFSRWASLGGMFLLLLYYAANPSFIGNMDSSVTEGNYLIVNKNLIELIALWVIFQFHDSKVFGLDFIFNSQKAN
jgi:thiosulfate dehydrogenase [quinone] large subunit